MTDQTTSPQDLLANLDASGEVPVLYGEVFLPQAASIEAIFDDPKSGRMPIRTAITVGYFVLVGPRFAELTEVQLLDAGGNVLRRVSPSELEAGGSR